MAQKGMVTIMKKKSTPKPQKSKFYDASEILKHEQDGTKYILQIKRKATKLIEQIESLRTRPATPLDFIGGEVALDRMRETARGAERAEKLLQEHQKIVADSQNRAVLASRFDDMAQDLVEQYYERGLIDLYESGLRDLKRERLEQMTEIGICIEDDYDYLTELTDRKERIEVLKEIAFLLKEYGTLLGQCERLPWAIN